MESKALVLLVRNCRLLGALSSALAGFSFMGITSHLGKSAGPQPSAPSDWLFAFTALGVSALGCALLSFIVATAAALYAPGMALHGQDADSLHLAVGQLRGYFLLGARLCATAFALVCAALLVLLPVHGAADEGPGGSLAAAVLFALPLCVGIWRVRHDSGFLHRASLQLGSGAPGTEAAPLFMRSVLSTLGVDPRRERGAVL